MTEADEASRGKGPIAWVLCAALAVVGCSARPLQPPGLPSPPIPAALPKAPPGFEVVADRLDAWNAVGQLLVRTDGVQFEARAEMLDLHAARYRGEGLLILTRAVPLSASVREPTVRVTAAAQDGAAVDTDAAQALLAHLQAALPAEITRVRAVQAAEAAAAAAVRARKPVRPAKGTPRR